MDGSMGTGTAGAKLPNVYGRRNVISAGSGVLGLRGVTEGIGIAAGGSAWESKMSYNANYNNEIF